MQFSLNGQPVEPDRITSAIIANIQETLAQHICLELDDLACRTHGSTPDLIPKPDGSGFDVRACCEPFLQQIRARLNDANESGDVPSTSEIGEGGQIAVTSEPNAKPPVAFISHASPDKERFVRRLADLLAARGIRVWLDERDLLPGRNLVDEIFNKGISKSDIVIIVLSQNSIARPWVTEELSVAVVQKIAGAVKLIIPIVLDGVTPPPVLSATVWENVGDLSDIEKHVDRIAASIFGVTPPPVAPRPAYAGIPVHRLSNLEPDDERVFKIACEQLLANANGHPIVDLRMVAAEAQHLGMPEDHVYESVHVLDQHYYFHKLGHYLGENRPLHARITHTGFERYLTAYRPIDYRKEKLEILGSIVNGGMCASRQIAASLAVNECIVDHVLESLSAKGDIQSIHTMDGIHFRTNPSITRTLRQMEAGP
jgi:hypothetical protein